MPDQIALRVCGTKVLGCQPCNLILVGCAHNPEQAVRPVLVGQYPAQRYGHTLVDQTTTWKNWNQTKVTTNGQGRTTKDGTISSGKGEAS